MHINLFKTIRNRLNALGVGVYREGICFATCDCLPKNSVAQTLARGEFTLRLPLSLGTPVSQGRHCFCWCPKLGMLTFAASLSHQERFLQSSLLEDASLPKLCLEAGSWVWAPHRGCHRHRCAGPLSAWLSRACCLHFIAFLCLWLLVSFLSFQLGYQFKTIFHSILFRTPVCLEQEGVHGSPIAMLSGV